MTAGDPAYWDDFFQQNLIPVVLAHIVATWERMRKPAPGELEDKITLRLYSALVNRKDRSRHPFLIRYEDVEVDTDLAKETGRKDIVVFPGTLEEIYFCLEAKRLNAVVSGRKKALADEYVKAGMQRFVDAKYAKSVRHGAMLGYVLDGRTDRAIKNVEANIRARFQQLRMDPPGRLPPSTVMEHPLVKETLHRRSHETTPFHIHHLFMAGQVKMPAQGKKRGYHSS